MKFTQLPELTTEPCTKQGSIQHQKGKSRGNTLPDTSCLSEILETAKQKHVQSNNGSSAAANGTCLLFCLESIFVATIVKARVCVYPAILLVILLRNEAQFLCDASHFINTMGLVHSKLHHRETWVSAATSSSVGGN